MNQLSPAELKKLIDSKEPIQIIDIREPYEYEYSHLEQSILMPMATVSDKISEISRELNVIIHCRTGKRAEAMIDYLECTHNFTNLHNLTGGILAWSEEIDASKAPY